jgi:hypothetical protein
MLRAVFGLIRLEGLERWVLHFWLYYDYFSEKISSALILRGNYSLDKFYSSPSVHNLVTELSNLSNEF